MNYKILNTNENIRFAEKLTENEINEFNQLKQHLEIMFMHKNFNKEIQIGNKIYPIDGRPESICRWYLSSDAEKLYYDERLDDYLYDKKDNLNEFLAWLFYLIHHFFEPRYIRINGICTFNSYKEHYFGKIKIFNNCIEKAIYKLIEL